MQLQFFEAQLRLEQDHLAFHKKVAALLSLSANHSTRLITVAQTHLDFLLCQPFCPERPLIQWQNLLIGTGESLQQTMLEDSSAGKLLRRNSAFFFLRPQLDQVALEAWTPWHQTFEDCRPLMDGVMQTSREKIVFKGKQRFRVIQGGLSTQV